jgi:hypothetical protein
MMALSKVTPRFAANRRSMALSGSILFASGQRVWRPYKSFTSTGAAGGVISRHLGLPHETRTKTGVGIVCLDLKPLLEDEQKAWEKFRHLRDSKWSSDDEILRSHNIAFAISQKLRDHLAIRRECKEAQKNR